MAMNTMVNVGMCTAELSACVPATVSVDALVSVGLTRTLRRRLVGEKNLRIRVARSVVDETPHLFVDSRVRRHL